MNDESMAPDVNVSLSVDSDSLTLIVEVVADYIGFSVADFGISGFGSSYIIDFDSVDAAAMNIREPGTCSNRNVDDFEAVEWSEIWKYSPNMNTEGDIGGDHLAYPPSTRWIINQSAVGQCTGVRWTGQFSWFDLLECTEYDDDGMLVDIQENAEWVNMSGVVFVNLVSPLTLNTDSGISYFCVFVQREQILTQ